jgi:hypothetical protein
MSISRYVAVGKDQRSLERLTEHLPYTFALVTTPDALLAQRERPGSAVFLVDDAAPDALRLSLQDAETALWLVAPENMVVNKGLILKKPFRMAELAACVERLCAVRAETLALAGGLRLHRGLRSLMGAQEITLTELEDNLLYYLVKKRGEAVPREELFRKVWGFHAELDTHTLETHIYRLRGKIGEAGGDPALIATTEGGYRLG